MNEYLLYVLLGLVFLVLGYFIGIYIQNLKTKSNQSTLLEREHQLRNNLAVLNEQLAQSNEQVLTTALIAG